MHSSLFPGVHESLAFSPYVILKKLYLSINNTKNHLIVYHLFVTMKEKK